MWRYQISSEVLFTHAVAFFLFFFLALRFIFYIALPACRALESHIALKSGHRVLFRPLRRSSDMVSLIHPITTAVQKQKGAAKAHKVETS